MQWLRYIVCVGVCWVSLWGAVSRAADFQHVALQLPQHTVISLLEDRQGYLWFGTGAGLARYDGYQLQSYFHQPGVAHSLSHNLVLALAEDPDGSLWIATNNGISRYRRGQGFQRYLHQEGLIESQISQRFHLLYFDPAGRLWAAGFAGLYLYDRIRDRFQQVQFPIPMQQLRVDQARWQGDELWVGGLFGLAKVVLPTTANQSPRAEVLYSDHPVTDWMVGKQLHLAVSVNPTEYTAPALVTFGSTQPRGRPTLKDIPVMLFLCEPNQTCWGYRGRNVFRFLPDGRVKEYVFSDSLWFVSTLFRTSKGDLLLAVGQSIYRYHAASDRFVAMTIEQTSVQSSKTLFFESSDQSIWATTNVDGLFKWTPSLHKFQQLLPQTAAGALADANVIRIAQEDPLSNSVWLASDNGQLFQAPLPQSIHDPITNWRSTRLPDDRFTQIHTLYPLNARERLIGTTRGLLLMQQGQPTLQLAALQLQLPHSQSFDEKTEQPTQVLDLKSDGHCLWLASTAGLGCADLQGQHLVRWYGVDEYPAFANNRLYRIYFGHDGALWLAGTRGLIRFDPTTKQLQHFQHELDNPNSLSHNWVHGIWQNASNEFWIVTREGGLNRLIYQAGLAPQWQRFGIAQGLPTEVLYGILGDAQGRLWISSNQGIFSLDPRTFNLRRYQQEDGLQSLEFNFSVMHQGASGRFYFGGVAGANVFLPSQIQDNPVAPKIALAGLHINEQAQPLPTSQQTLALPYDHNNLQFDVLALQYADPSRNRYAYQLLGLEENWQSASTSRQVRYPALPPGTYQFWAKAANPDGIWSEPKHLVTVTIAPHPLRSPAAYVIYTLLVFALLYGYKRWRDQIERSLERRVQQGVAREAALNKNLRLQFEYTAHEMRTPLTRLRTHLQRCLNHRDAAPLSDSLQVAAAAQQELQLLIERQLAVEELKLQYAGNAMPVAVSAVIANEVQRYRRYAAEKLQQLRLDIEEVQANVVPGVLELICDNLLSNAIKYTQVGGEIALTVRAQSPWLLFSVQDNGPGIATSEHQQVWLRHYRVAGQATQPGSGEGLFLVKSCVEAAGGEVQLHSDSGLGCLIQVRLPLGSAVSKPLQDQPSSEFVAAHVADDAQTNSPRQVAHTESLLIVEDHLGLLADLHSLLSPRYQCLLATSAEQAATIAKQQLPDLVISDVMMEQPNSGFTLLDTLKSDNETCHIPVVLLTALGDDQNRLTGIQYQADAYLTKPASESLILAQVESLLNQRWRISEFVRRALTEAQQLSPQPTEAQRFAAKLHGIFAHLYANSEVQVLDIAQAFGKSPSALQKLAAQHLQQSLKDSLRDYRLEHAVQLLEQEPSLAIERIAEQCGFGSIRSLQRDFKQAYGVSPQHYRDGQRPLQRPPKRHTASLED